MKHPWGKMFEKALRKSKPDDNLVFEKAVELLEKGYRPEEILDVLIRLQKSLIDEGDEAILKEAAEDFREEYLEEDS
jgi:hypothetical protein